MGRPMYLPVVNGFVIEEACYVEHLPPLGTHLPRDGQTNVVYVLYASLKLFN